MAFLVAPAAMAQGEPAVSVAALSATVETGRPTRIPHRWLASLRLRCAHVGAHPIGGVRAANEESEVRAWPRAQMSFGIDTEYLHQP